MDERNEHLEFAFPNLNKSKKMVLEKPYIYILVTRQLGEFPKEYGEYTDISHNFGFISVYPTLKHLAYHFSLKSMLYDGRDYSIRAWWADNQSFYVPYELLFDSKGQVLAHEVIPEHFRGRTIPCYRVDHIFFLQDAKKKGDEIQGLDLIPVEDLEYIPQTGWVDINYPWHSKYEERKPARNASSIADAGGQNSSGED